MQETLQKAEREITQAKAALEAEQAKASSRASALAEAVAQQQADSRVLAAAKTAWAQGEADRATAAAQLEEARSEAAKVKVWAAPSQACLTLNARPIMDAQMRSGLLHLPLKATCTRVWMRRKRGCPGMVWYFITCSMTHGLFVSELLPLTGHHGKQCNKLTPCMACLCVRIMSLPGLHGKQLFLWYCSCT